MEDFNGLELRMLRKMCNLTGGELALLCGVVQQTVSNWELEKVTIPKVIKVGIITILSSKYPKEVEIWKEIIKENNI